MIPASALLVEARNGINLPARPLLALRRGAGMQRDRVIYQPGYSWFCYDDPPIGYGRLEALLAPISDAYLAAPVWVASTAIGSIDVTSLGAQQYDDTLKLNVMVLQVTAGAV